MPNKKYDYLVYIGRFQPFHNGHKRVVDRALELADKVIILIGSANSGRRPFNPWTFEERKEMIERSYTDSDLSVRLSGRIIMVPIDDYAYNLNGWIEGAQRAVTAIIKSYPGNYPHHTASGLQDMKIGLIGCKKDDSSFYLNMFPDWTSEEVPFLDPINATDIRKDLFTLGTMGQLTDLKQNYPAATKDFLELYLSTPEYKYMKNEMDFLKEHDKMYEDLKFPPMFVTADAVIVQSGHILLIRRRAAPGLGKIALPGGYVERWQSVEEAVYAELKQETKLKVPEKVLRGNVTDIEIFDDPNRSERGRIITHAFKIELPNAKTFPKVKGASDAKKAFWMPLSEVKVQASEFFEDHWHIIQKMIG